MAKVPVWVFFGAVLGVFVGGSGCRRDNPAFEGAGGGAGGADADGVDGQAGGGGSGGGGVGGGGGGAAGGVGTDAAVDKSTDKPADVVKDVSPDLPPDLPKEMPPPAVPGCSDGTREGFLDAGKFPTIAACGELVSDAGMSYGVATATAVGRCAPGWHWCHAADLEGVPETLPTFKTSGGGTACVWLSDGTDGCSSPWKFYENGACEGGAKLVSTIEGFDDCDYASSCVDAWRPVLRLDKWNDVSAYAGGFCRPHVGFACGGKDGGDVSPSDCWIACCKG